ncbi:hypothetical protein [Massilia sp. DWR3-1-1]|uniref:hypothetical protein n=1 Tax=Massilia sp. DWR3-1-1 TaxID=2804559 RepID=UPI003CF5A603
MNHHPASQNQPQQQQPARASSQAMGQKNLGNSQITRAEYRKARRLIRENGRCAFRWLAPEVFVVMDILQAIQDGKDRLAERADIVAYCKRQGIRCNPRQTA